MEAMKRSSTLARLSLVLLSMSIEAAAQEAAQTTPQAPVKNMTDVILGLGWGSPTRLTASATIMWSHPKMLVAHSPGKLAQIRIGARGGQVGLGIVSGTFEESAFKPSGIAVTLKAIALRTWRRPVASENGITYAGLESDVVILGIRGSVGYTRRVSGSGGPRGRFVWSLGLGL
jgi:hypothetical protein